MAVVAVIALAFRLPLLQGLELGHVIGVVLAPLWLPVLLRHRGAPVLALLVVAAVAAGAWLTGFSAADHDVSSTEAVSSSVLILGVLVGVGVLVWARTLMPDASVAVWFGVGMVIGINPDSTLFSTNVWKFGLAVPVAVLLLALAWRSGRRWVAPVVLVVLVVLAGVNDARSELAILLLVLLVVLWNLRPTASRPRASIGTTLLGLGGLALVVYQGGQALILEGYLGEATRQRTEAQLDGAGSVIVGGRPEIGAAVALFQHHPWGFGSGTLPNLTEIQVAKTGMAALNYDPDNGYVEDYLFGSAFELHSVLGDLWTRFGLVGILLTIAITIVLLAGAASGIAARASAGLVVYVVVKSLWNIPFSPVFSAVPLLMLALGMTLVSAGRASSGGPVPDTRSTTAFPTQTTRRNHGRDTR
ncbi:hypothetical protein DZG00_08615 [Clavibacter lycopersici]|uniref:O-antigen ligase domain-containing protein n=1 Tax=Clavibacter lycopersici TaxID=2301718 RepID=A0A399T5A4_9MICO|nr:hypothetical protein [Clavibacter lycopersici]RIJ51510.1 hypothetical protein DZG00_08615 [Clavibacter lycopersici]RIJ59660.1 hypothetical protein DZG02_11445 [Clavibacter lycopersici]